MKCKHTCKTHGLPCDIQIRFQDARQDVMDRLKKMVPEAEKHNKYSKHMCPLCIKERDEDRPAGWYCIDPFDGKIKPRKVLANQVSRRWDNKRYY